ncbi:hypothetical protein [Helicobacter pylori]|uniref:hypothetical protein n=1 Tax=Helicobacter pylori TaxID=210 RepID=UPI0013CE1FDB|nr:hypothetical protein [Helicobacter pylori]
MPNIFLVFGVNAANLQYNTPHTFASSTGSAQSYAFIDMMRESCKECVGAQTL